MLRLQASLARRAAAVAAFPAARAFASLPPHTVVGLPALSPTMKSGNIAKWVKKEGDLVRPGEMIAQIETDKATVDFESQEEGYIAKILLPEGSADIPLGTPVAVMVDDKDSVPAFASFQAEGSGAPAPAAASAPSPAPAPAAAAPAPAPAPAAASSGKSFPRHTVVGLPALSPTMKTGNLEKWLKKEGDEIKPGQVIAQIGTDKAVVDFEAQEEGFLAKILVKEGATDVELGTPVAIVVDDEATVKEFASYTASSGAPAAPAAAAPEPAKPTPAPAPAPTPKQPAPAPAPAPTPKQPTPAPAPTPAPSKPTPSPGSGPSTLLFEAWGKTALKHPLSAGLLDFQKAYSDRYGATLHELPQPAPKAPKAPKA